MGSISQISLQGETFNQHDAPRNNKQAHDPLDLVTIDLDESSQRHSLPDFEIVDEDDPGNKPLDRSQHLMELAMFREQVQKGTFNPFQFGDRAGFGSTQTPNPDLGLFSNPSPRRANPEDFTLHELLFEQKLAVSTNRHLSVQMVVEECAHLDPSRVGGHSHYASKPFDNLSDQFMIQPKVAQADFSFSDSGRIPLVSEREMVRASQIDVQIPDNCELLSDRMKFLERSSLKPQSSMLSSRPSTTTSSLNASFSRLDCRRDPLWSPQVNQGSADSHQPYNGPGKQLASAEPCQGKSLYSMIQSQVISLKTNKFRGLAAISK